jgi:16S rRNA (adenine1518-N6/adenine1519-N6)-dimethyltransferase
MQNKIIAKKKYGQNFLTNTNILAEIIEHINFNPQYNFLEIGPGYGALTEKLIQKTKKLTLVEIDKDCIFMLKKLIGNKIEIIHKDILSIEEINFIKYDAIIGNLPYYISTEIIFKFLKIFNVKEMYFMLQKEVGERLIASPGKSNNSILTNLVKFYFDSEVVCEVPAESFNPIPKVNSIFIKLKRHSRYKNSIEYDKFKLLVKTAFQFKRKNLRNNLKNILPDFDFERLQIKPTDRAEDLTIENFIELSHQI